MADMPGESQEEPSVMVVAMLAAIRLTSYVQMSFSTSPLLAQLLPLVTQRHALTADYPSDLFVEIERVKVLLRC